MDAAQLAYERRMKDKRAKEEAYKVERWSSLLFHPLVVLGRREADFGFPPAGGRRMSEMLLLLLWSGIMSVLIGTLTRFSPCAHSLSVSFSFAFIFSVSVCAY